MSAIFSKYKGQQGGGTGSVAWGMITGTLSAQTDLQTALNAKAPTASPTFTGEALFTPQTSGTPSIGFVGATTTGFNYNLHSSQDSIELIVSGTLMARLRATYTEWGTDFDPLTAGSQVLGATKAWGGLNAGYVATSGGNVYISDVVGVGAYVFGCRGSGLNVATLFRGSDSVFGAPGLTTFRGGISTVSNTNGGAALVAGGDATGNGTGGTLTLQGGATSTGTPGVVQLGAPSSTLQNIINNAVYTAGSSVGTLTNAPSSGNPAGYLQVTINGTTQYIPYW